MTLFPKIIRWYIDNYCSEQKSIIEKTHLERILDEWWKSNNCVKKGLKDFEIPEQCIYYLKDAVNNAINYTEECMISKDTLYNFLKYLTDSSVK